MTGLPIPKFAMGQTVYLPGAESAVEHLLCPDCLDTRQWKVITPAGTEMETVCQRCSGFSLIGDLPKPERRIYKPIVTKLTIGQIDTSTQPFYGDGDLVRYMCTETGVGSGSIYNESRLFASPEEAMAAAETEAVEHTSKVEAEPSAMSARRLDYLTVKDAVLDKAWSSSWNAWYAYRKLKDVLDETLGDDSLSSSEKIEALESESDWDTRYRDLPAIGDALDQLRSMLPDTEEAASALAVLMPPKPAKAEASFLDDLVA